MKDAKATSKHEISYPTFFLFLWVIFAFLDQDPDSDSESGSNDLNESGSQTLGSAFV
jgi:hypothetical protein